MNQPCYNQGALGDLGLIVQQLSVTTFELVVDTTKGNAVSGAGMMDTAMPFSASL